MQYIYIFFIIVFSGLYTSAKESNNFLCHLRGYEIIFPYEEAIYKIKDAYKNIPETRNRELLKFRRMFEIDFHGISLYREAGCSGARLSEYLDCLISTDGKDCKIYYSQMRIVD